MNKTSLSILILIVLGFKDTSTLVGHFKSSPREEIAEEIKERDREERGTEKKVKKQNINIPPLPLPATRIAGLAQL